MSEENAYPHQYDVPGKSQQKGEGGMRTRRTLMVVVLIALLALLAFGIWLAGRPVPAPLEGIVDTDEINISSKVFGRVDSLEVREGDQVEKGQLLVIMSSPEVDAGELEALASLSGAEAMQDRSENGSRDEDIAALEASWHSAQAQAELAEVTARRASNLYAEGVIAAQRRDEAIASRDTARRQVELTHAQYLRAVHGDREEDRRVAASNVQVAEAGLLASRSLVKETRLDAPVSGEIANRFANPGELIPAGIPVFSLIDLDDLWVTVNLREDRFHSLAMGDRLTGTIPALDDQEATFQVSHINPRANFATWRATRQSSGYDVRSFEIRLRPLSEINRLRPGMTVLFEWPQ